MWGSEKICHCREHDTSVQTGSANAIYRVTVTRRREIAFESKGNETGNYALFIYRLAGLRFDCKPIVRLSFVLLVSL